MAHPEEKPQPCARVAHVQMSEPGLACWTLYHKQLPLGFIAFSSRSGFLTRLRFQAIFEAAVHCPLLLLRIWVLSSKPG